MSPSTHTLTHLFMFLRIPLQRWGLYLEQASNVVCTGIARLRADVTAPVCARADSHPHGRDIPSLTAPIPSSLPSLLPESPNPFFSGTDAELGVSSHCFRQHFRSTGEGSLKQNMKRIAPLAAHVGVLKGRAPYMHAQTRGSCRVEATLLCVVNLFSAVEKSLS